MKRLGAILQYARAHKIISIVVIVVLLGGGYYWYSVATVAPTVTKYVVENATTGTIVSSVSATGQVQAGTTINVTPKVSEDVTSIPVTVGEHVYAGQVVLQLDPTNEQRALNQAQLSLEQAQLSAQETNQVATTTLLQQKDAVTTGEQSVVNASTTLAQDYQSGFDSLGPMFVNLQTVMTGLQSFMNGTDISKTQSDPDALVGLLPNYLQAGALPYETALKDQYAAAVTVYQKNLTDYHAASATSNTQALDSLFTETYNTTQSINATVKAGKDLFGYVSQNYPTQQNGSQSLPAVATTLQNNFSTYTSTMSSVVSGAQSTISTIASDKNNIMN